MNNLVKCKREALKILVRRDYFSQELEERLTQKGFSKEEVQYALAECTRLGILDDERVLDHLIKKLQRQGKGPHFIVAKLMTKGIFLSFHDPRIANDQKMTIEAFVEKKIKNKKLAPEKLFRLLLRRGFDAEEIKRYMYENH